METTHYNDVIGAAPLSAYVGNDHAILGDLYLTAQHKYWGNHQTDDGSSGDYHAVSRFYLGWLCFFGDPSLRLPALKAN
jgi:hypothetical protein